MCVIRLIDVYDTKLISLGDLFQPWSVIFSWSKDVCRGTGKIICVEKGVKNHIVLCDVIKVRLKGRS